jgi:NADH:ubiquinone oxidoreductase subunit 5 (subunit L)/multisubunit Na+/H+ antiporter MnhA subunit
MEVTEFGRRMETAHTAILTGMEGMAAGVPHDAPPAMAIALVVLALGSVFAGFIGLPHAIGHNILGEWLEPAFKAAEPAPSIAGLTTLGDCAPTTASTSPGALATLGDCAPATDVALASNAVASSPGAAPGAAGAVHASLSEQPAQEHAAEAEAHDETSLEWMLMGVSTLIAILGIGLATYIWLQNPRIAAAMEGRFPGVYRLLLNKYYVDELYDVTVVQPVKIASEDGLWRGMDARLVDGAVNGTGQIVGGLSAVLRLLQSGSVKTYAASTFLGVVVILAYYLWR